MCPQMALDWVPVRQAQGCFHVLQHHLKWLFIDFHEESSPHGGIILSKVVVLLDDFGFKVQGEEFLLVFKKVRIILDGKSSHWQMRYFSGECSMTSQKILQVLHQKTPTMIA